MKTAISVPDDLFEQAERLAKHLELSRSELYQRALGEFIARHAPDEITSALDRVCDAEDSRAEPFVAKAARRTFERAEW